MVAWFFPCSFSAPALALAYKPGCWVHQWPQGGLSVFILKQLLNSFMLLSPRILPRRVILDPFHGLLSHHTILLYEFRCPLYELV